MSQETYYLLVALCCVVFVVLFRNIRKRLIVKLIRMLKKDNKPKAVLHTLNHPLVQLIVPQNTREFLSLQAYIKLKDDKNIVELFRTLPVASLKVPEQIYFYQLKIAYYLEHQDKSSAIEAYLELKEIAEVANNPLYDRMCEECDTLIHVYARHDDLYTEKMLERAKASKDLVTKGIFYYRAGVCFYNKGDEENCIKYLQEAHKHLKDTILEQMIEPIINTDLKLIETKIM